MKTLIILSLFFFQSIISISQDIEPVQISPPIDSVTGKIKYVVSNNISGQSKDDLFFKAKFWIVENYNIKESEFYIIDEKNSFMMASVNSLVSDDVLENFAYYKIQFSIKNDIQIIEIRDIIYKHYWRSFNEWKQFQYEDLFPVEKMFSEAPITRQKFIIQSSNELDSYLNGVIKIFEAYMNSDSPK